MPKEGSKAPAFSLPADDGSTVKLSDYLGKPVVLYFYPKDNTPGCTRQAQAFRDAAKEFKKLGAVVLGVSRDSIASHCKFRDSHELNFRLLSDPDHKVHEKYDAWGEKTLYGKTSLGALRTTVVIDSAGKISKIFPKVRVDGHAEKVLEALKALA